MKSRSAFVTVPNSDEKLSHSINASWEPPLASSLEKSRRGRLVARRCVMRWQKRKDRRSSNRMTLRTLTWKGVATEDNRSRKVGFVGEGRNAIEKSVDDMGEEGVMITAGRRDFSVTIGRDSTERSSGAGIRA